MKKIISRLAKLALMTKMNLINLTKLEHLYLNQILGKAVIMKQKIITFSLKMSLQ